MAARFSSPDEVREVIDRLFQMMDEDPSMGPELKRAEVPQRWEFTDVGLVVNVRGTREGEPGNLHWEWAEQVDWEPKVTMAMSSETANRYFQGKENVAFALARRKIKTGGDIASALRLAPITKPIYPRYSAMVADEYPHLRA